jgi:indole-3-glycerol phosphate synthase
MAPIVSDLLKFREAKSGEIEALIKNPPQGLKVKRPDFLASLQKGRDQRGLGILAEYKRASPSLGDIDLNLTPAEALEAYEQADGISVLTEELYFKGNISYLEQMAGSQKALLRKDFIFHPLQITATSQTAASAVLIIVRLCPDRALLKELISLAQSYALAPVVEVHGHKDLEAARWSGAEIILVNARDLETLQVSSFKDNSLIQNCPPLSREFWIAASGLKTGADLRKVRDQGFGGSLLGTALMKSGDPGRALNDLIIGLKGDY